MPLTGLRRCWCAVDEAGLFVAIIYDAKFSTDSNTKYGNNEKIVGLYAIGLQQFRI